MAGYQFLGEQAGSTLSAEPGKVKLFLNTEDASKPYILAPDGTLQSLLGGGGNALPAFVLNQGNVTSADVGKWATFDPNDTDAAAVLTWSNIPEQNAQATDLGIPKWEDAVSESLPQVTVTVDLSPDGNFVDGDRFSLGSNLSYGGVDETIIFRDNAYDYYAGQIHIGADLATSLANMEAEFNDQDIGGSLVAVKVTNYTDNGDGTVDITFQMKADPDNYGFDLSGVYIAFFRHDNAALNGSYYEVDQAQTYAQFGTYNAGRLASRVVFYDDQSNTLATITAGQEVSATAGIPGQAKVQEIVDYINNNVADFSASGVSSYQAGYNGKYTGYQIDTLTVDNPSGAAGNGYQALFQYDDGNGSYITQDATFQDSFGAFSAPLRPVLGRIDTVQNGKVYIQRLPMQVELQGSPGTVPLNASILPADDSPQAALLSQSLYNSLELAGRRNELALIGNAISQPDGNNMVWVGLRPPPTPPSN
jgi:hypothetical protein